MKPAPRPEGPAPLRPGPARALTARGLAAFGLAALVAGCTSLGSGTPRPAAIAAPPRPAEVLAVDPLSADIRAYYQGIETQRVANRLMRTDGGQGEVTITAARLAETYAEVALRDEHPTGGGAPGPSVLRRWQGPVRYSLEFGASTGRATRAQDYREVQQLAARLASAAQHPISVVSPGQGEGNFHVLVLSESERRGAGDRLRALVPGIDDNTVRLMTDLSLQTFCIVLAFSRDGSATYTEAVAVIRAEHPDLTRRACYHEELTQGLGLAADSPRARPSIFNDDQEFALLTPFDILMLRLHYDPRLTPGMTPAQARPIIFSIASELVAGAS